MLDMPWGIRPMRSGGKQRPRCALRREEEGYAVGDGLLAQTEKLSPQPQVDFTLGFCTLKIELISVCS